MTEVTHGDLQPVGRKTAVPGWNGKIYDWAFRSEYPGGGAMGGDISHWWYWWDDACQERFEELWTQDADRVADDLADRYWFSWPWIIGPALATAAPETADRIMQFAQDPSRPGPEHIPLNPTAIYDEISTWGSFQIVRRRRTWNEPRYVTCPVCRWEHWNGTPAVWMIKKFGPARYCQDCCFKVRKDPISGPGIEPTSERVAEVIYLLRELHEATESVPTQAFASQPFPADSPDETRDRWMRALVRMPDVATVKHLLGVSDWLGVLQSASIVGDSWRPTRGTWCRASDGHRCRSLLEKSIDDWLTRHGIDHECEPHWPAHPVHNPSGRKRADWLLSDGTYVECAGMIDNPDYAVKIASKRELASELGIYLLVIGPTDMHRLDAIFGSIANHPESSIAPSATADGLERRPMAEMDLSDRRRVSL